MNMGNIDLTEMFSPEELLTELQPYVNEPSDGFVVFQHPLVYQVPYSAHFNKMINLQYKDKLKAIRSSVSKKDYHTFVFLHERPYRVNAFYEVQSQMTNEQYWSILSSIYTDSENIHECFDEWQELFDSSREGKKAFMEATELLFLETLEDSLTVYRGYSHSDSKYGLSWTLDKKKAEWFSQRNAKSKEDSFVAKLCISKKDIFAYKSCRNESEVILLNAEFL